MHWKSRIRSPCVSLCERDEVSLNTLLVLCPDTVMMVTLSGIPALTMFLTAVFYFLRVTMLMLNLFTRLLLI
jgi:hypothetical protein